MGQWWTSSENILSKNPLHPNQMESREEDWVD
uniref:Uncharacterized protein n=1 Tax=Arundo donax TaxID=35708 RepID=A0A0A9ARX3_ARUDO